ncbi:MAG: helix-turn-helix transcriptional regulator [Phycisphaerales bacterium]|nr:MAG: helix-turn-helix transcriptional regulator [Phycisphaerales bacterium]
MRAKNLDSLTVLCHHRWSLPVLAELHAGRGAKFVTLARRLGVSRDSLSRTLAALMEHGLLKRNPGYGHPMRPEYVLTPAGARLAPWCLRLVRALRALRLEPSVLRKWSLPVLAVLQAGQARFCDLKTVLPGITPRALTLALKDMENAGLIQRRVLTEYPPATCYQLTARSRPLRASLRHLDTRP